jgi:hypothetical protein
MKNNHHRCCSYRMAERKLERQKWRLVVFARVESPQKYCYQDAVLEI